MNAIAFGAAPEGAIVSCCPFETIGFNAAVNSTIEGLRIGDAKTISVMNPSPAQVNDCGLAVVYISRALDLMQREFDRGKHTYSFVG